MDKKTTKRTKKKNKLPEILLVISVLIMGLLVVMVFYKNKTNKFKNATRKIAGDFPSPAELIPSDKTTYFSYMEIPDMIFRKMDGVSYSNDNPVNRDELRYLQLLYWGTDNAAHKGEMIVNAEIADKVVDVFYDLYKAKYPIESVQLVEDYGGNDEVSMGKNNTSCFNGRKVKGSEEWSDHAYGMAIDLNPLYNPYVGSDGSVYPVIATEYTDRNKVFRMKIDENDFAYITFTKYGFTWGGHWEENKDYQHFSLRK